MAEPHRYEEYLGKCRCGLDRWHAAHFNGDGVAAAAAFDQHKRGVDSWLEWQRTLAPGMAVMVSENHPKPNLAGVVGRVVSVSRSNGRVETVGVKLPGSEINLQVQWVCRVPLPDAPPKFNTPEEADRWLEDTAREMGLKVGPDVPQFASQEEADEWLEAQERAKNGDPYVPPSWRWDEASSSGAEWVLPNGRKGQTSGAYERSRALKKIQRVQGQQAQLIVMDEQADIIDPYVDDK